MLREWGGIWKKESGEGAKTHWFYPASTMTPRQLCVQSLFPSQCLAPSQCAPGMTHSTYSSGPTALQYRCPSVRHGLCYRRKMSEKFDPSPSLQHFLSALAWATSLVSSKHKKTFSMSVSSFARFRDATFSSNLFGTEKMKIKWDGKCAIHRNENAADCYPSAGSLCVVNSFLYMS